MNKVRGNFRYCHGENIKVYTAEGKTRLDAVKNLMRGLKQIERDGGCDVAVQAITVSFYEEGECWYDAVAYVGGY